MDNTISIMSGKPLLKINREFRELKTEATIVVGNLFRQNVFERRNEGEKVDRDRSSVIDYLIGREKFDTYVYHCYGSDDKQYLSRTFKNLNNYHQFDRLSFSEMVGNKKIVGISGFYNKNKSGKYSFTDNDFFTITNREQWCDILCINSLSIDGEIQFSVEFYNMLYKLRPKLLIIGNNTKFELTKFPTTNIQTIFLSKNDHILYDMTNEVLFRKL